MEDEQEIKAIAIVCITLMCIACLLAGIDHFVVALCALLAGGVAEKEILQPILGWLKKHG